MAQIVRFGIDSRPSLGDDAPRTVTQARHGEIFDRGEGLHVAALWLMVTADTDFEAIHRRVTLQVPESTDLHVYNYMTGMMLPIDIERAATEATITNFPLSDAVFYLYIQEN